MTTNLHEIAVTAEQALEQLATGLAEAGADENTVKTVSQMADVCRTIVKALGRGQETTGDDEPAADENEPERRPRSFDDASREMMDERRRRQEA